MTKRKFDGEWMPFYGDWMLESERVEQLSDGAYRLYQWLLWRQWKHESLPPDPSAIVPGRFAKRWRALWGEVHGFFELGEDGRLRNETCAALREDAAERRGKASTRGRNGAQATNDRRWGTRSDGRSSDRSSDPGSAAACDPPALAPPIAQASPDGSLGGRTGPDSTGTDREPLPNPPPSGEGGGAVEPPAGRDRAGRFRRRGRAMDIDPATHPLPAAINRPDVRAALVAHLAARVEKHGSGWGPALAETRLAELAGWGPERAVAALVRSAGYPGVFEPHAPAAKNGRHVGEGAAVTPIPEPEWKRDGFDSREAADAHWAAAREKGLELLRASPVLATRRVNGSGGAA